MSKLGGGPGSNLATEEKQDAIIEAIQDSTIIKSWTREVVIIGTTPVVLLPDPNQIYIRIVPLSDGNFYYGPDATISFSNSEVFSKAAPIEITIDNSVYIVKESGSGSVCVYRGSN
jgi:hypothetical protein